MASPAASANTSKGAGGNAARRMSALPHKGAVKGKGGPTSDSIDIKASKGEYMLPADTVQALGGPKVLDKIVSATHKLSSMPKVKEGKPAFADGGEIAPEQDRAVFGLYPQLTGHRSTLHSTGNALRTGVQASGPSEFSSATSMKPPAAYRMNNLTDPRSTQYVAPAPAVAASSLTPNAQPTPSVLPQPTALPSAPAPGSGIPASPAASTMGSITRVGNSYSGVDVPAGAAINNPRNPGAGVTSMSAAAMMGGSSPSLDAALATARAGAAERGDFAGVRASYGAQGQAFGGQDGGGDQQLRNLAFSPIGTSGRGYARRMLEGERTDATARRGQDMAQGTAQQRLTIEKSAFDRQGRGVDLDNAAKAQLQAAQTAYANAMTPDEQAAAEQTLRALQGKYERETPNKYTVVPRGTDETGRNLGAYVLDSNGRLVDPAAQAPSLPAGLVVGAASKQADGIYDAAGKKVTIKNGKVAEIK